VGGCEPGTLVSEEPSLKYHPCAIWDLTEAHESGSGTVSGGQFDWGGRLLKGNGGIQRFPQTGRQSVVECKGIRELNCERGISSRYESRA
jgi:hypothetical protein